MSGGVLATAFVEIEPETRNLGDKIAKGIWGAIGSANLDGAGKKAGEDLAKGTDSGLKGSSSRFKRAGEESGRTFGKGLGGGMKSVFDTLGPGLIGGLAGGALVGGIAAVGSSVTDLVGQARKSAAAGRITSQVIKTTGGAAHITAAQVDDLATSISNKTGVDDDAIRTGENMLLTFTNVRNEVGKGNDIFNQATSIVTDVSTAMGTDAKGAAIQLGKALNDPVKGVSALQEIGVSFTEQQKKQIATLVKHGDTLGAQKIILKELGKEFGGAAAAASDPMAKLGVTLGNIGKDLASKLLPWLDKAATWFLSVGLPAIQGFIGWVSANAGPVIAGLASFFTGTLLPALSNVGSFITTTAIPAIKNLADGFMKNVWPAIQMVAGMIATNLQPVIAALADFWRQTLLPALQAAWPVFLKIEGVIWGVAGVVAVVASWLLGKLVPAFLWLISKVLPVVITVVGKVVDVIIGVGGAAKTAWEWISSWFGKIVGFVGGLPDRISAAASGMWDGIKNAFRSAINWLIDTWNGLHFQFPSFDGDWNGPLPGGDFTVGGWTLDTPNIPRLAGGGIVPATRGGRLVVAGDGNEDEIVTSRSRMRDFMGGAGGAQFVFHIDARGADAGSVDRFKAAAREVVYDIAREVQNS